MERTPTLDCMLMIAKDSSGITQILSEDTSAPTWSTAATALNTTVECSNEG
jgi:hypothetical protein